MKNRTITLIATVVVVLLASLPVAASDQIPAAKQARPIALVGATVHTVIGPPIENATIVFENGRITEVGRNAKVPTGADRITVTGKHVYPGIIAANTSMGLVEINAVRSTRDYAETGSVKPNVRAEVSVNPDSEIIPVSRANGITMALTVPVGGLISGTSALIELDGWTWEDMTYQAPVGLHVFWPNMSVSTAWWERRSKEDQMKARDENLKRIKTAFTEARAYAKAKAAEQESGVPYHDSDLRWTAMQPVLAGDVPVFIHASSLQQIQAAVGWASDEGLRVVIVGGRDAWRVTGLLKEKGVSVIYTDVHRSPGRRWEDYDVSFKAPLKLYEAGIPFCISSSGGGFGTAHVRSLPYQAAAAASYGLPKDEALRAVTIYPAQILGVGDRVGSLEVGKDATLIVTNGDPLEITTNVEMEFIRGRQVDLTSRHTMLYDKYRKKYEQLKHDGDESISSRD